MKIRVLLLGLILIPLLSSCVGEKDGTISSKISCDVTVNVKPFSSAFKEFICEDESYGDKICRNLLYDSNKCVKASQYLKCGKDRILNGNSCEFNCPSNSARNSTVGGCTCIIGYKFNTGTNLCEKHYCKDINSTYDSGSDSCDCNYGFEKINGTCDTVVNACGSINSVVINGTCGCKDGFIKRGNQCTNLESLCGYFGAISIDSNGICNCSEGYKLNHGKCEAITCNENEKLDRGTCICKDGFTLVGGICKSIEGLCGANTDIIDNKCVCKTGTILKGGKCLSRNDFCINGSPGYNGNKCLCSVGFINDNDGSCIKIKCGQNEDLSGNECFCKTGFYRFTDSSCYKLIDLCGVGGHYAEIYGYCTSCGEGKVQQKNGLCE